VVPRSWNKGTAVEAPAAEGLVRGELSSPYARQLLAASRGYDREVARRLVTHDRAPEARGSPRSRLFSKG
jgi:hypothetical protein